MSDIRDIDIWFIDEVLPHEARYLSIAARLTGDPDAAADLVHDAYARLFETDAWRVIDSPPAYVMRMVRNLAIAKLRRSRIVKFEALSETYALESADPTPDPYEITSARQSLRHVAHAIAGLPQRCREVLELRRFHDLTSREIAIHLGQSLSTIEKRLARGLFLLAQAKHKPRSKDGKTTRTRADPVNKSIL
ncbi:RNA polymerase sigma factor [Asticcacaulis sp. SL142]|uniref:RNA polymerase sigma factor n=1 Tax=Asticcacaulis sp. SL142 TaxID=2995155 RepID=UPI00226D1852|nr:RNA polymerase sigma factor [Asticcacaulis sp. SL142]WAC47793.1 RNA polymerase sigma factor [Asticcacaulis sp. SL142]